MLFKVCDTHLIDLEIRQEFVLKMVDQTRMRCLLLITANGISKNIIIIQISLKSYNFHVRKITHIENLVFKKQKIN